MVVFPSVSATYERVGGEQYAVPFMAVTVPAINKTSFAKKGFNRVFQLPWKFSFSANTLKEIKKIASTAIPFLGPVIAVNQTWDKFSEAAEHFKGISALKKERRQIMHQIRNDYQVELGKLKKNLAEDLVVAGDQKQLNDKLIARQRELEVAIQNHRAELATALLTERQKTDRANFEIERLCTAALDEAYLEFSRSEDARKIREYFDPLIGNAGRVWNSSSSGESLRKLQTDKQARLDKVYEEKYARLPNLRRVEALATEKRKLDKAEQALQHAYEQEVANMRNLAERDCNEIKDPQLLFNRKEAELKQTAKNNLSNIGKTFHDALQLRKVMAFNKTIRSIGEFGWTAALIALTVAAILRMFYLTNSQPDALALLPKKIAILGSYVLGASFGVIFLNELAWTYMFKENFMKKLSSRSP